MAHWALWVVIVLYALGTVTRWIVGFKDSDTYAKVIGVLLAVVMDVVIIVFAVIETLHM